MFDPNLFFHLAQAAETATTVAHSSSEPGIVDTLGINFKIFIAQLVNFGVVLFILWKWVFNPVTKALQARTQKIETSLKTAESVEQQRTDFAKWKNEELSKTRKEAMAIISEAKTQADSLKTAAIEQTKTDQEALIAKTRTQLEYEQAQTINHIKTEVASLITEAAEVILREKLDPTKDKQLIKKSLDHISNI